jgi:hypothetical protein
MFDDEWVAGVRLLGSAVLHAESKGFRRRPRIGDGEFDLVAPDGRVVIWGFEPEASVQDPVVKARHIMLVVDNWRGRPAPVIEMPFGRVDRTG